MKIIDLNVLSPIVTRGVKEEPHQIIQSVLEVSPNKSISLEEMRRRLHIGDALEKAVGTAGAKGSGLLKLEDADHAILAEAMKTYPWTVAKRELVALIDAVADAKAPSDEPEVSAAREGKGPRG